MGKVTGVTHMDVVKEENIMKKDVMIVTGAGQIGMAIARRTGFGKKILLNIKNI